ncbi:MBL fold metallo-hydrolase [Elstera litoralis]|uniref:MBL fold metallo-hydrolase n=1 Tax=Elstera litoralis TaxID=552518 RepID=UPI000697714D|nr:ribonuclease Z [Elstera litoralis]
MIEIDILGCGEAFDPDRANAAVLVTVEGFRLLIDCGMGVPQAVWQRSDAADFIDAVYFTHLHVDHCGGLPALIDHMGARGRTKTLVIYGPDAELARVNAAVAFAAWPNPNPAFPIDILPKTPLTRIGPMQARVAQTEHAATNHALRLEFGAVSFFYSGDGRPTDASRALMTGATLAFHEAQSPSRFAPVEGHCDFDTVAALLDAQQIGTLWLYHTAARSDAAFLGRLKTMGEPRLHYAVAGLKLLIR